MFGSNLTQLRRLHRMTQEDVAAKLGVTRQAIAKWETGASQPDLDVGRRLAELFGVSLDELVQHETENPAHLAVPPKGRHLFGVVTVGEKGQIIIPAKARRIFHIEAGDQLVILGDEAQGIAILKADGFLKMADEIRRGAE